MRRFLPLTILLILALTAHLHAENAVRFSDAVVEPGGEFTVDLIIANEAVLGGAYVPYRWSSPDLVLVGFEWIEERLVGNITGIASPPDPTVQTSAITIVGNREEGWIAVGDSPIGRIRFRAKPTATDQYVFVDSVFQKSGDIVVRQVNFSNLDGSLSIYPETHPGVITIGDPPPATMSIVPSNVTVRGETGGLVPVSRSLEIRSDGNIQFDWEADWSTSWLDVSPPIGKTPAFPSVNADAFLLFPGVYHDTIVISSPIARNSPLLVPVAFVVDTASTRPPEGFGFSLGQSKPSPFVAYSDPETRIPFLLEEPSHVVIELFDILGRRIKTLTSGSYGAGEAEVIWDGRDARGEAAASGHYICRMSTESGETSRVIVLIR